MRFLIALSIAVTSPTISMAMPTAQSAVLPFVRDEAREVVAALASRLEADFVFPDKASAYAALLRRNLAAGRYDHFADSKAFAAAVTADLQAVHADRHLRLIAPRNTADRSRRMRVGPPEGNQLDLSGWLSPGVAYASFEAFPGNPETLSAIRRFLADHSNARTLIIDARRHDGGGLAEMDLLFSALFARPTPLVLSDTREDVADRIPDGRESTAELRLVNGPAGVVRHEHWAVPPAGGGAMSGTQVFLLVSGKSASAAEHLALALKRTDRAILIGEPTRGAGHYGHDVALPHGYFVFIPFGRTFDPDTGEGWEGVGVAPDVAVAADKALDEALKRAGVPLSGEQALAGLRQARG